MPGSLSYCFAFVCQAAALENKALLLAATLRRYLQCEYELVAAVPTPASMFGAPAPDTLDMLREMGARIVEIENEIDPAYPIGNKVSCLKIQTRCDRLVFLDTDMVLARPFRGIAGFSTPFAAKPADLPNMVDRRQWRRAYAAAGIKVPDACVCTTVYGQTMLPYFNAGFVAVDPVHELGKTWADCCRRIDRKWGIRLKRPHLDQIALPVAVARLGLSYLCLDERYNFPAHLKPICPENPPFFAHYHSPEVLRREPMLVQLARDLCGQMPALAARFEADPDYAPIFNRRPGSARQLSPMRELPSRQTGKPSSRAAAIPELIITGIPRSGTSYLCNLLHRYSNCVVLNEPDGVNRSLRKEPIPYGVGAFYRDIRRDVLEGRPIRNKLRDGKVTDETMEVNEQSDYLPEVENDDFVLGVKNPLGFLSRLRGLRRAMPQARVVLCVRNPFDTIASWKTTFSHLKTADVARLWNGGLQDPSLSARARGILEEVAKIDNVAWRRAAWWRYLADLITEFQSEIILVPYQVVVQNPMPIVQRIMAGFHHGVLREPIERSTPRTARRSALDGEDYQAIRALCGQAAAALGVEEEFEAEPDVQPINREIIPVVALEYRAATAV
jgi:hypothetical protein